MSRARDAATALSASANQRKRRAVQHREDALLRDTIGFAGEYAFADWAGLQVNTDVHRFAGDGGADFTYQGLRVDVKTTVPGSDWYVNVQRLARHPAEVYVCAEFDADTEEATLVGWCTLDDVLACPVRNPGRRQDPAHQVTRAKLGTMATLQLREVQDVAAALATERPPQQQRRGPAPDTGMQEQLRKARTLVAFRLGIKHRDDQHFAMDDGRTVGVVASPTGTALVVGQYQPSDHMVWVLVHVPAKGDPYCVGWCYSWDFRRKGSVWAKPPHAIEPGKVPPPPLVGISSYDLRPMDSLRPLPEPPTWEWRNERIAEVHLPPGVAQACGYWCDTLTIFQTRRDPRWFVQATDMTMRGETAIQAMWEVLAREHTE